MILIHYIRNLIISYVIAVLDQSLLLYKFRYFYEISEWDKGIKKTTERYGELWLESLNAELDARTRTELCSTTERLFSSILLIIQI